LSAQQTIATALATQPAAAATALSAKVSSPAVTDVPKLSRKTALVAVGPHTDTADATATDATAKDKTPKADASKDTSAKDATSTGGKPDHPGAKSPKHETDKLRPDPPKHETAKADNRSQSDGAEQK
jgi:hypothetical protein